MNLSQWFLSEFPTITDGVGSRCEFFFNSKNSSAGSLFLHVKTDNPLHCYWLANTTG